MKIFKSILALTLLATLFVACSKEDMNADVSADLTTAVAIPLQNQTPTITYDHSKYGIYHGILAAAASQSRGKIWINIGNDSQYNAVLELAGGATMNFNLQSQLVAQDPNIYTFVNNTASFVLDLNDYNAPVIIEAMVNGEVFFGNIAKSRSYSVASSVLATFSEPGNPFFSGTWSLLSDGSITNPNGMNGEAITSLMITMNGEVFMDTSFNTFNADGCLGIPAYTPTIGTNGTTNYVISNYQTAEFAMGTSKWELGYDPFAEDYINYLTCEVNPSGTFSWSNPDGTVIRNGGILVD